MLTRNRVSDIRDEFRFLLENKVFVTDKTGVKMLEIPSASFIADEPAIFGTVNQDYVSREIAWYNSQSLNVNDIPGGPPAIWKQVADTDGYINSNYGWCIWSDKNCSQYKHVREELSKNPESRRATMIYNRPNMWYDYNALGRSDFMCTNAVQYLIRDNQLHAVVQMRSNDVVFGYKNDYAWQKVVLDTLCTDLSETEGGYDITPGKIYWNAGSLHVYERHFGLLNDAH
jgi:thymidylate synthase